MLAYYNTCCLFYIPYGFEIRTLIPMFSRTYRLIIFIFIFLHPKLVNSVDFNEVEKSTPEIKGLLSDA